MTITETATEAEANEAAHQAGPSTDLASIVATGDHKRIGRLFLGLSLVGLIATLVLGLLMHLERLSTTSHEILTSGTTLQVFSAHRLGLLLLFALPALLGLAMVVVPLQVGASTLAFGRAAALALWGWLLGAILWVAGFLVGGGPGGTDLQGTDVWLLATGLMIASLLLATICVVTTVLGLRTTGMTLRRVPAFSFSMLVAGTIWLLTLPVAIANLALIYLDHRHAQVMWGANEAILAQLHWLVDQPQIYVVAIPVLGIIADQIPVFAGARQRFPAVLFGAIGVFGFLSIGSWAQPALLPTDIFDEPLFVGFGVLAILPVLMVLALGGDTMRSGGLRLSGPLVLALCSGLALLGATAAGAVHVIEPLDLLYTTWTAGHIELTMFAVALAVFSGIWFWAPKLYGRLLNEGAAHLLGLVLLLAALLTTVPLMVAGVLEQPDTVPPGVVDDPISALNAAATAGIVLALLAVLALAASVLRGRGATDTADDPWGGHTLEWATASPPPVGNFAEAPVVTDDRPLFTESDEEDASA